MSYKVFVNPESTDNPALSYLKTFVGKNKGILIGDQPKYMDDLYFTYSTNGPFTEMDDRYIAQFSAEDKPKDITRWLKFSYGYFNLDLYKVSSYRTYGGYLCYSAGKLCSFYTFPGCCGALTISNTCTSFFRELTKQQRNYIYKFIFSKYATILFYDYIKIRSAIDDGFIANTISRNPKSGNNLVAYQMTVDDFFAKSRPLKKDTKEEPQSTQQSEPVITNTGGEITYIDAAPLDTTIIGQTEQDLPF